MDNCDNALKFFRGNFSGSMVAVLDGFLYQSVLGGVDGDRIPFVQVHIGFLAHQVRIATPYTLDFCQGVHDFLPTVDIGIEKTKDELKVRFLSRDER